jgi:hypothetical protein
MKKEKIATLDEARAKGLTIPLGVVEMPNVSAEISEAIARSKKRGRSGELGKVHQYKYGVVVLEVPAAERLRPRSANPLVKGDVWREVLGSQPKREMMGRVLKHQLGCGFVSLSTHLQNVYNAPGSLCPHADNSDLVPISEILRMAPGGTFDGIPILEALVMRQLMLAPFAGLLYRHEEKGLDMFQQSEQAIRTILSVVAEDQWESLGSLRLAEFQQKPLSVLQSITRRLIEVNAVQVAPQADWSELRDRNRDSGYEVVAEMMIDLALEDACKLYDTFRDSEERGIGIRVKG